ncbi:MAG: Uma2 family endonuclease [Chloroflexi bacterium]|nr:Uma2 family endonuclease [Chloroflexota bacterium]
MIEVVSNGISSSVGAFVGTLVGAHVLANRLGFVTGADGGYMIGEERYIPDFAYVSRMRQAKPTSDAYNPIAPDLAVEVLSPSNSPQDMRIKIVNYLNAGTTVWLFDPYSQRAEIYAPGQKPLLLGIKDTIEGGTVLPGFTLALSAVFESESEQS